MNYVSTRGGNENIVSAEAIIQGLSANGGLFVPTEIPTVDEAFLAGLTTASYWENSWSIIQKQRLMRA